MRRIFVYMLFIFIWSLPAFSSGVQDEVVEEAPGSKAISIVATSTWTKAFVEAAGYKGDITVLAPSDYRHPSEYELLPSQVVELLNADYVVYAGYEAVAKRISDGSLKVNGTKVQIQTVNTIPVFTKSILELSALFNSTELINSTDKADQSIADLKAVVSRTKQQFTNYGYSGIPVVCHKFLTGMAVEMGFNVVGTFGPAPPSPTDLKALSDLNPQLIIDNWHVDTGKSVAAVMPEIPRALLINFPGHKGTSTLSEVLEYNRNEILSKMNKTNK